MQLCTTHTAWSHLDQAVRAMHSCNSWWSRPLWSNSVNELVSVLFGKCTTLMVTKFWPMETRLPCGDQWKAEKLEAFKRWPITRCFIKSDRAVLFIEHSINFRFNGEHWRAVQYLLQCDLWATNNVLASDTSSSHDNHLCQVILKPLNAGQSHWSQYPKFLRWLWPWLLT